MGTYTAQGRWFLTRAGDAVVAENHPEAATLFATPGLELDEADAEAVGLPAADKAVAKAAPKAEAKAVREADVEDKGAAPRRGS